MAKIINSASDTNTNTSADSNNNNSNANTNSNTTNSKNFLNQLQDALKLYTSVIFIASLKLFTNGWPIFGDVQSVKQKQNGRVVAVVGFFKTGKTWFIRRFLNIPLKDSQTVPTLGVSLILPQSAQPSSSNPVNKVEGKEEVGLSKWVDVPVEVPEEKPLEGFIFLDTQGSQAATHWQKLPDKRATEWFQRDLVLSLSNRILFLTDKMDAKCQEEIESLIKQLENHDKTVSPSNRLIIIHNWREVQDKQTMDWKIQEIRSFFDDPKDEPCDIDINYKEVNPWLAVKINNAIVYNSRYTSHYFFVNDNKLENTTWNIEHNNAMFDALRTSLIGDNPVDINMLEKISKYAVDNLETYVEQWDPKIYEVVEEKIDNQRSAIVPKLKNSDSNTPPLAQGKHFRLQKLFYGEAGVTSASKIQLEGEIVWDQEKSKIYIRLRTPGLSSQQINDDYVMLVPESNRDKLAIYIDIDPPEINKTNKLLYSNMKFGRGKFVMNLQNTTIRFRLPRREQKAEFYKNNIKMDNGVLTITLDAEDNDVDVW